MPVDIKKLSTPEKLWAMTKLLKAAKYPLLTLEHGAYPNKIRNALVADYPEKVGTKRTNRSPLDVAINYGGVYDLATNPKMNIQDLKDMALAYQLLDYSTGDKQDAIQDYEENIAGIEAAQQDRQANRVVSEKEVARRAKEYAKQTTDEFPAYAEGGLVYNAAQIDQLADTLLG